TPPQRHATPPTLAARPACGRAPPARPGAGRAPSTPARRVAPRRAARRVPGCRRVQERESLYLVDVCRRWFPGFKVLDRLEKPSRLPISPAGHQKRNHDALHILAFCIESPVGIVGNPAANTRHARPITATSSADNNEINPPHPPASPRRSIARRERSGQDTRPPRTPRTLRRQRLRSLHPTGSHPPPCSERERLHRLGAR